MFVSRTFTSLRKHRNYRLYFSGQFVSQAGTWLQSAAQAWLVLEITHSPAAVGVLTFWQFGPYALFGLVGGTLTDRMDQRKTLIWTQVALMVSAVLLAVLTLSHLITIWEIDAIAALRGLVLVLNNPSRQAFIVQMVGRDELPNAIALNSSVANATRVLGPGMGGVLIATLGVGICFAVNAASFLAVIVALLMMREQDLFPLERRGGRSLLSSLGEGMAYAWQTPRVLLVLTVLFVVSTLAINFNVMLPVLAAATLHSGPVVYGLVTACFGGGALLGALLSASLNRSTWPVILGALTGFGIALLLLAPQRQVIVAMLCLLALGVCYTMYTSNSNAMVQIATPGHLQGRVAGLYSYIFAGTSPLGAVLAGWMCQVGGTELAFLVAGIASVLMAGIGFVWSRRIPPTTVLEETPISPVRVQAGGA